MFDSNNQGPDIGKLMFDNHLYEWSDWLETTCLMSTSVSKGVKIWPKEALFDFRSFGFFVFVMEWAQAWENNIY